MKNTFFSVKLQKVVAMIDYLVATLICFFGGGVSIKSQKGVTMIEYALIAALVAVAAIATITALGDDLSSVFTAISDALDAAI